MCGIAGIFAWGGSAADANAKELIAIRDRMSARGPDAAAEWRHLSGRVAFGHRRLSIIDLSDRATQPMSSDDGQLVIVFNGEIYNFAELKSDMEANGHRFRTSSDTEVLLHLYEAEGAAMVRRLRGMFALAIWDERRGGVFLARDPYGIKPLYYANDSGTFRFASQVKALLAGGAVSREPDSAGLVGFHLFGHVPEPFTTFRAISAVPAGATLWVGPSGVGVPEAYANLAAVLANATRPSRPPTDLGEQVRAAVLNSVRAHLVADVEVGAFLSSGIDSGAVVGLMRDAGQTKIKTVTLTYEEFQGSAADEAPLAERVAQMYGAQHTTRLVTRQEFQDDLPLILDAMDQPSIDGVNTWFVSKSSKELGLKVALSGVGGDELFGGYSTFVDVPRWRHLFGPLASVPGMGALSRTILRTFASGLVRRNPKVLGLLDYPRTWAGAYLLRRAVHLPFELEQVLDAETIREGMKRLDPLDRISRSIQPDPGSSMGRVVSLESANYMRSQLLRDTDWAGMAHSLEIRTPLVDFALLKTLAPLVEAFAGGEGKRELGLAPSTPLPPEVINRAKTGFGIPLAAWSDGTQFPRNSLGARQWAHRLLQHAGA
jgi:asparagine synthase (glutamine-hydrolysing)